MAEAETRFGDYRLIRPIARGGMAELYLAESAVGRLVVVKRMRRQIASDPTFVEMFLREAAIAVRMQHGNIAQVFDFGEVSGEYFLVMEYVQGLSLAQLQARCAERGVELPYPFSVSILADVARALDHAHRVPGEDGSPLGIVHRDVSPQNVMLSLDGQVKLVDFGIAKGRQSQDLTRPGVARGKVRYFAPEQVRREPVDARTDVHACGVVLFELITGRPPYDGEVLDILEDITVGAFASPADVDPSVPEALDRIVLRAMATDPARRYPSAGDLERDLLTWLRATAGDYGEPQRASFLASLDADDVTVTATRRRSAGAGRGRTFAVVGATCLALAAGGMLLASRIDPVAQPEPAEPSPLTNPASAPKAFEPASDAEAPRPSRQELIRRAPPPAFRFVPGPGQTFHAGLTLGDIAVDPRTLPAAGVDVAAGATLTLSGEFKLGGTMDTRTQQALYWLHTPDGRIEMDLLEPGRTVVFGEAGRLHVMGTDPGDTRVNTGEITAHVTSAGRTRVLKVDGRRNVLSGPALPVPLVEVPGGGRFAIEVDGEEGLHVGYIVRRPLLSATVGYAVGFSGVIRPGELWSLTDLSGLWFFVLAEDPAAVEGSARVILRRLDTLDIPSDVDAQLGHQLLRAVAPGSEEDGR